MADLAPTRAGDLRITTLAAQIRAAQAAQITAMAAWLHAWGQVTPPLTNGAGDGRALAAHGVEGHDMPGAGMPPMPPGAHGMMSHDAMNMLRTSTGRAFDRLFLTMTTEHHGGALDMAATELKDGTNAAARGLADDIRSTQASEITYMRDLVGQV
jgi:uncharacterized protein (DUF305 family)